MLTGCSTRGRLVVLLPLLLVIGCQKAPEAVPIPPAPPHFAILDEDGQPILMEEQIAGYEWATHTITLQPGATLNVRRKKGQSLVHGVPFAVVADGITCYRGVVITGLSSVSQEVPVINGDRIDGKKDVVVRIELGYPTREYFKGEDPRGDERVRQALRAIGKLQE